MSKKNVLSVKKLNKIYRKNIHALKDLNLEVKEGEILGLLGPNGCLLYTSPSPRDRVLSRMPSSA